MRTLFLSTLAGVVVLCVVCTPVLAQTTGTIRGQIKDADGDPLPGVTVTVTSQGRGTSRTVVTGETGAYALPSMAVETYTVAAVLPGFQEQKFENKYGSAWISRRARSGTTDPLSPLDRFSARVMILGGSQNAGAGSQMLELEDHGARKANAGFCHSIASAFVGASRVRISWSAIPAPTRRSSPTSGRAAEIRDRNYADEYLVSLGTT